MAALDTTQISLDVLSGGSSPTLHAAEAIDLTDLCVRIYGDLLLTHSYLVWCDVTSSSAESSSATPGASDTVNVFRMIADRAHGMNSRKHEVMVSCKIRERT